MKLDKDDIDAIAEAVGERIRKKRLASLKILVIPLSILLWVGIIIGLLTILRDCSTL